MLPRTSTDMFHIHAFFIDVLHASIITVVCMDLHVQVHVYHVGIKIDVLIHF